MTGERRRRLAATDEDDPPAGRDLGDGLRHDVVKRGLARQVLVVVEDDREWSLQPAVELAEEAPREHGDAVAVLGCQQRERPPAARRGPAEVVEERGDVGVAFVDLVPEPAGLAPRKVARHQRRLARARRRPYPGDWFLPGEIEPPNQPSPHQDLGLGRTGGLRQRHNGESYRPTPAVSSTLASSRKCGMTSSAKSCMSSSVRSCVPPFIAVHRIPALSSSAKTRSLSRTVAGLP